MHRTTRAALALMTVSVALGYLSQRPTEATPAFAKKEGGIPCGYCHVRASGGGKRNYRGSYYQMHNLSFAGFDDAAEAKTAGAEVAPFADVKPASLTPPAAPVAPAATPTPAPMPITPAATASAVAAATTKAHAAMVASAKSPKDAALKKAYVSALANLTHETLLDQSLPAPTRFMDTEKLAKRVLALDPKNASAIADLKAATSALKVEKARGGPTK